MQTYFLVDVRGGFLCFLVFPILLDCISWFICFCDFALQVFASASWASSLNIQTVPGYVLLRFLKIVAIAVSLLSGLKFCQVGSMGSVFAWYYAFF